MFNQKKDNNGANNQDGDNGFDSGEDDDLIEIGKHKGTGAKSVFQNLESLTGDQIIQEDKYANEFKQSDNKTTKNQPKNEVDVVKEQIEAAIEEELKEEESKGATIDS